MVSRLFSTISLKKPASPPSDAAGNSIARLAGGLVGGTLLTILALVFLFNLSLGTFWPILLVGLGVRLLFERSRAPWAILLSPLLKRFSLLALPRLSLMQPRQAWSSLG